MTDGKFFRLVSSTELTVSFDTVGALARGCHQLTRLDLEELVHLNDATIGVLASNCLNLTTLTLSHCKCLSVILLTKNDSCFVLFFSGELITDEALKFLAQAQASNPILKVLELDNCPLITDEGLNHLSRLSSLKRLEIYDCQQLSRQGIRSIASAIPYLKVHAYFAPNTPPILPQEPGVENPIDPIAGNQNNRAICRCCSIL
jgi:F-box/leucine-rich repeat protein 2/20